MRHDIEYIINLGVKSFYGIINLGDKVLYGIINICGPKFNK